MNDRHDSVGVGKEWTTNDSLRSGLIDPEKAPETQLLLSSLFESLEYTRCEKEQEKEETELSTAALKKLRESARSLENSYDEQIDQFTSVTSLEEFMSRWFSALCRGFEKETETEPDDALRSHYVPYLRLVPPDILAMISIQIMLNRVAVMKEDDGVSYVQAASYLGKELEQTIGRIHESVGHEKDYFQRLKDRIQEERKEGKRKVAQIRSLVKEAITKEDHEWDTSTIVRVGGGMLKVILENSKIPVRTKKIKNGRVKYVEHLEDAFRHIHKIRPPRRIGKISTHPFLQDRLLKKTVLPKPELFQILMPMLVPPRKWEANQEGGFLRTRFGMLRKHTALQEQLKAVRRSDISKVRDGLNALAEVPWKINEPVYQVASLIYMEDLGLAGFIPESLDPGGLPDPPEKPKALLEREKTINEFRKDINEKKKKVREERHELVEQAIDAEQVQDLMLRFKKEDEFLEDEERDFFESIENGLESSEFALSKEAAEIANYTVQMFQWRKDVDRHRRYQQEIASKRMSNDWKMKMAKKIVEEKRAKRFWFPYSLDFRGRAYPIPAHLNHIGDDLSRGLLCFADGKPLGKNGLFWLKVQLANSFGVDKVSFEDRVAWTDEHLDQVHDCAENPIDWENPHVGKWWTTADTPFQALSVICELHGALKSKNPEQFVSHIPVQQDGSCNGLQHYAALGRDEVGGNSVNLVDGPRPADVYSTIAEKVLSKVKKDAEKHTPEVLETVMRMKNSSKTGEKKTEKRLRPYYAKLVSDKITRKVVKQTVMTSVYGVTFIGARKQIQRRLEEINDKNEELKSRGMPHDDVLDENDIYYCAKYLADTTLEAIGDTFKSASEIKQWIKDITSVVCNTGMPMTWITPLGLPVVQPYRKPKTKSLHTQIQHVVIAEFGEDRPIQKQKQKTAAPPNFIHSLDSTHMLMTAIRCKEEGITFASVHDSYWCHASDVDRMSGILRESFVDLHSQNILEDLYKQVELRFPQHRNLIPKPPERGNLDINEVLNSRYFFN